TADKDIKRIDPIDLLVKIINSKDSEMLFDADMSEYTNYSQYKQEELVKISNALTNKIKTLTTKPEKTKTVYRTLKNSDLSAPNSDYLK
ncbi:MAG: DNA topoisomerase VI subunit B, partial [Ulvibacter sp.]